MAGPNIKQPKDRGAVLVVDDDAGAREVLLEALRGRGFDPRAAASANEAVAVLERGVPCDVVLTDLRMPGGTGLDLARRLPRDRSDVPVIVITAFGSIEGAVGAIRNGAYDFLTKPYDLDVVALSLDRAIGHRRLLEELVRTRREAELHSSAMIGSSTAMARVRKEIARFGATDATILITGESGTGKELAARAIHDASPRADGPFVAVNCAAISENLLESELFGHVRGAFTDARSARQGLFVQADGGTLLLDEIGDMPLAMQSKLLRVLEERTVRPVGADTETPVDVRVIAATHRNLDAEVQAGRFRADLAFRVQVIELALPPLRARGHDVLELAHHFVREAAKRTSRTVPTLPPDVAELLLAYSWPGNVRELANAMERAVALASLAGMQADDLPERVRAAQPRAVPSAALVEGPADLVTLEEIERRYVTYVMDTVHGNKRLAAQILGLDRSTLYRKLEQYGLHSRSQE